jgi:hypothetical protein
MANQLGLLIEQRDLVNSFEFFNGIEVLQNTRRNDRSIGSPNEQSRL